MSKGRIGSVVGLVLGVALILLAINRTISSQSARYWPLWLVGTLLIITAGPLYYYFKSKDRHDDPYRRASLEALASAGKALKSSSSKEKK